MICQKYAPLQNSLTASYSRIQNYNKKYKLNFCMPPSLSMLGRLEAKVWLKYFATVIKERALWGSDKSLLSVPYY